MWKGQAWIIICKVISGLGLFIRFSLILICHNPECTN